MNYFVSIIVLEDGVVDSLVGPFASSALAMDWADKDSLVRTAEADDFERESTDEMILVSHREDQEPGGYIYQVLEALPPDEIVEAEPINSGDEA